MTISISPCLIEGYRQEATFLQERMMVASTLGETMAECLCDAISNSKETQQRALQALAAITGVNPQNRSFLSQTDGAIPTLLSLTKSPSPGVQILSLSTLFNLSLNPDLKQSLSDMETISHLNSVILSPSSSEASRLACSLVCSLAMLDKNKAKFGVAGTVQVLVDAISKSNYQAPASHHLLSSLAELVQFHGNCTLAVRSGAVQALIGLVESRDYGEDLAGTSLAVLGLLARFGEGLNALVKMDRIVGSMVEVLKGRCMLSKEGAAEILIRLFDESEGCVREAMMLPEFSGLLADLSVRGSSRARDKAGQLLRKMIDVPFMDSEADSVFTIALFS